MIAPKSILTPEETEIYDRQIRVWGFQMQQKLSSSSLLIYNADSINAEIAKNCILSGLNIKVFDSSLVDESDLSVNLFITSTDVGKQKDIVVQEILSGFNTLVQVSNANGVEKCSILCYSGCIKDALIVNSNCREQQVPSYYIFKAGKTVLVISDLLERFKSSCKTLTQVINSIADYLLKPKRKYVEKLYCFLCVIYCEALGLDIDQLPESFIDREILASGYSEILKELGKDYIPSIMVVAGLISQDIVRFLSHTEHTFQMLIFDGDSSIAYIDEINSN